MIRNETEPVEELQKKLNQYLSEKNIKATITKKHVLITGMMRVAGKTHFVLEFLLKNYNLIKEQNIKILYITKMIGKEILGEKIGTYTDTLETINKIRKQEKIRKNNIKICMMAGINKICKTHINSKKQTEHQRVLLCHECRIPSRKIPADLKTELKKTNTLELETTIKLAQKYNFCPKKIQKYHQQHVADITFVTYSKRNIWKPRKPDNYIIIYDEARHLMERDNVNIRQIKSKDTIEIADFIKQIKKEYELINSILDSKKIKSIIPEETKELINIYFEFTTKKCKSYQKAEKTYELEEHKNKDIDLSREDPAFIKTHFRTALEVLDNESGPQTCDGLIKQIKYSTLKKEKIQIAELIKKHQADDETKSSLEKIFDVLNTIEELKGSSRYQIELLRTAPAFNKEITYTLTIKKMDPQEVLKGMMNFYLEGTPFPERYYRFWFQQKPEEIDEIILEKDVKITIVYENAKKTQTDIYGHGSTSTPLEQHIDFIKSLLTEIENIGLTKVFIARTNYAKQIIAKKIDKDLLKPMFVCGGSSAEGVQYNKDVAILEGVQIRNIGVDKALNVVLAYSQKSDDPDKVFREYQTIVNLQIMCQSVFRAIDRDGKYKNAIILIGNQIPWEDKCWIEIAKEFFPYLKSTYTEYFKIPRNLRIENKVKKIIDKLKLKSYDDALTSFENEILYYINKLPNKMVKQSTLVKYFLRSRKSIRKTKSEIYKAIKELERKNRIEIFEDKKGNKVLKIKN